MKRPNTQFCRRLRKNQTDAEKKLWSALRNRQITGTKFRRQYASGRYIIDFYAPEYKLGIESDGGQHYEDQGKLYDKQRTESLQKDGIRILRFSDRDILIHLEDVCEVIRRKMEQLQDSPSPPSSPPGERKL